jgi:hypothetical protein
MWDSQPLMGIQWTWTAHTVRTKVLPKKFVDVFNILEYHLDPTVLIYLCDSTILTFLERCLCLVH